jgi:hypothetical protein
MVRTLGVMILAASVVVVGCKPEPVAPAPTHTAAPTPPMVTSQDVQRDVGQAVSTVAEYSQQAKEEFQKRLAARLKDLDAEIAELREKGRALKDQAKEDWDRKMSDLEAKRHAARAKLAEIGESSADTWKDIQKGAQSAWKDLDKAFREAAREFDSSAKPN